MKEKTVTYTIMPDFGGAYGWTRRGPDDGAGVGGCHADTASWNGDHPISAQLQKAFAEWQGQFESAGYHLKVAKMTLDWASFHSRGIALARRLKSELGDAARIVYEKPMEDPGRMVEERREVLADGRLVTLAARS